MAGLLLLLLALQDSKPESFESRGLLVCLAEEMKEKHKAEVQPVHDHVAGFRVIGKLPKGGLRYYVILRTALAEALFVDKRFKGRELRLEGKRFPDSAVIEVIRIQWLRDGKLVDLYYWCDVCSIKGADPGPCACCQGKVRLREEPVRKK